MLFLILPGGRGPQQYDKMGGIVFSSSRPKIGSGQESALTFNRGRAVKLSDWVAGEYEGLMIWDKKSLALR